MKKNWMTAFKVKVTVKGQNVPNDNETAKYCVTKLDIVMQHHEPECHAIRLVCRFLSQSYSKGSCDESMTVS